MARLTKKVHGKHGINWHVAREPNVRRRIGRETLSRGLRAEAILNAHKHDGHSFIEVEQGNVDGYIILNDMAGQKAAMTIEFGRNPGSYFTKNGKFVNDPGSKAVAPLRKAAGLI